ncbi:hypothetical protein [Nocardioides deserti]|uniref:DUF4350 domain-containing protein n=1 Tax=Nocardioides deserti TaxID=1588644 RepID=A0ABR6U9D1_9ACTN|nr:hypothetical protein [Nocardioides deserti]MBC2960980.1 hypothetical protein [Nocardioides deserti]GGO76000.1 hypothetical protein GCM10012276_27720 [Nocardioides deserti]
MSPADAPADPPAADPVDAFVDELADALHEDPVQVDPMFGNGRTEDVDAALTDVVAGVDFPAYVVLAPGPDGLAANDPGRDLAGRLHERIGGDGVYLVQTDPASFGLTIVSHGDVPDAFLVSQISVEVWQGGGADAALSPGGSVARALEILDSGGGMSEEEFGSYAEQTIYRDPPEWDLDYEVPTQGTYAMGTALAFLAVGGCAYLLLRTLARWRETAPAGARGRPGRPGRPGQRGRSAATPSTPLPGPAQVRETAEAELASLARLLDRTADRRVEPDRRQLVDGSYDTARSLLERTGTDDADLDDLLGALVLVRIATAAAGSRSRSKRGGEPRAPYRPCFFDPRHGEGTQRRAVPVGGTELTVPACRACGRATDAALEPMGVRSGLLGRERPWYELDTVWARTGYGAFVDDLWQHVAADLRETR